MVDATPADICKTEGTMCGIVAESGLTQILESATLPLYNLRPELGKRYYKYQRSEEEAKTTTLVKGLSNLKPFRIKIILKRILLKDETKNI